MIQRATTQRVTEEPRRRRKTSLRSVMKRETRRIPLVLRVGKPTEAIYLRGRLAGQSVGEIAGSLLCAAHALDLGAMAFALQNALLDSPRARALLTAQFLSCGNLCGFFVGASFLELGEKAKPGGPAIDGFGAGILDRDALAGGKMFQRYSGGDFVDVLAAGATTAGELLLELCLGDPEAGQSGAVGGLVLLG